MVQKLDETARKGLAARLPQWRMVEGRDAISRMFTFKELNAAFGFMARAALVAEAMNHHLNGSTCGTGWTSRSRRTTPAASPRRT